MFVLDYICCCYYDFLEKLIYAFYVHVIFNSESSPQWHEILSLNKVKLDAIISKKYENDEVINI